MSDTSVTATPVDPAIDAARIARADEIAAKASTRSDRVRFVIAMFATLQAIGVMGAVLSGIVPEDKNGLIFAIVNMAGTVQGVVLGYYFGSSAGSSSKDAALSKAATTSKP